MAKVAGRSFSVWLLGLGATALCQMPAGAPVLGDGAKAPLSFEVVSIRPADPNPSFRGIEPTPDQIRAILTLSELVGRAYDVRPEFVLGGPKWCETTVYEIKAKVDESDITLFQGLSLEDKASMLRPVLASRFGLKIHTETRVLPVYDLVLAKGALGPDFHPHPDGKSASGGMAVAGENFSGDGVAMPMFTKILSKVLADYVGRPIVDKTELAGTYDFILRWSAAMPAGADGSAAAKSSQPDIFTAMQEQLGLKLQPARESVETIVIDSASEPTGN